MAQTPTDANVYFVPAQSKWPFVGSHRHDVTMVGVASWLKRCQLGTLTFYIGIAMLVLTLFWVFSDVCANRRPQLQPPGRRIIRMG